MILKSITLKNFRKYKNSTIEFPDGITGIVGLNGSGKSTIFEALAWVLYGPVAARTSADQIKKQNAENSDPCRVELDFIFDEKNYRIVREMTGKSLTASATATVDGKVAATSADSVSRYVQKKIGLDFKSFYTSIFAKQKELNALSSMNSSERRPLILRMLGIDSLDEIIKEIRSDRRQKEQLINKLNEELKDPSGKEKDFVYKQEIKKLEKEKQDSNKIIFKIKEKIKKSKDELNELEKKSKKQKEEYEKLNKKREELFKKKTLFEQKNNLEKELKELELKLKKREKSLEKEQKNLKEYKNVDIEYDSCEKRLEDIEKFLEKLIKTIEQKNTLYERLNEDISEIDEKRKNIKKLGPNANCPTCKRVLSDQYNVLIKNYDDEIKKKSKKVEDFKKEITNTKDEKERVTREKSALRKKRNYIQKKLREKERIDTIIKHLNDELKQDRIQIENKNGHINKIGEISFDIKEFENIKQKVQDAYSNFQNQLELLNNYKDKLSELNVNLEKMQGEKKLFDEKINSLNDKIKELEDYKKKVKDEKNIVHYLGMLNDVMSDFRTYLISRIRPTLSAYASDFFNRLTDGKYNEIELDDNYDLMVYDNGEKYSINRFSGGEEDLANLCLRLAISEIITERAGGVFNFIILDEIFGSQDANRRQNIMKSLNSLSGKFRQIFLITHVDEVKNDMENLITVLEDEKGNSKIKID